MSQEEEGRKLYRIKGHDKERESYEKNKLDTTATKQAPASTNNNICMAPLIQSALHNRKECPLAHLTP